MPAVNLPPLQVPLMVDTPVQAGESVFLVWGDSAGRYVRHARRPGFWSVTPDGDVVEQGQKRRLSDTTAPATTWYRLAFPTDKAARDFANERKREGYGTYCGDVDRYLTRVLVEDPDFFRVFPMGRPLRILAVDIEQRTAGDGRFPPRNAPIVSIALGRCDGTEPLVVLAARGPDGEPDDAPCLLAWERALVDYDPDVIAVFNAGYDLGVLAERLSGTDFPLSEWGRFDEHGNIQRSLTRDEWNERLKKTDTVFYVGGRVVWDLPRNANPISDYNLSGCKDFKLKTIAAFLGLPVIHADTQNTLALWRDRSEDLARYNANDAILVESLVLRYLPDRVRMAEFFGAPLDATIDVQSGWPGTIACARVLFSQGIVSDGSNLDRHRAYLKVTQTVDEDGEESEEVEQFAGAHCKIHRRGLFRPIFKVDFASLYPNILIAVGAGPDNTRIVGVDPEGFKAGLGFESKREGDTLRLAVPDENYGHRWFIEVRGKSAFTDLMNARMIERLAAKKAGDVTRANILKTQLNAMFGVNGSLHNKYGVLPVAILTAGVARVLIAAVERVVLESAIEVDTDGIYTSERPKVALCERAANKVAQGFGFEPRFELDSEEYAAGWFWEAKVYLLLTSRGKLKRFGQAFKGGKHPALFDIIIERVGTALLRDGREAALTEAKASLDFKRYKPADFVQREKLGANPDSYTSETQGLKVARAWNALTGVPVESGRSYEYVRTRAGVVPATPENLAILDEYAYLQRVVLPALERLGFADAAELGLEQRLTHAKARSKRPQGETSLAAFS